MKRFFYLMCALAFVQNSEFKAASSQDSINVSPFGKVLIYKPESEARHVVILISGEEGWKHGIEGFAEEFSAMNNIVIGVDIIRYFRDLKQREEDCYKVADDFVELAAAIEKKYNFPEYQPAVVMGYSRGATLVYGILSQARPGTFIGGISLGFCPDIELPKKLCENAGLSVKVNVPGKSYYLEPDAKLGNSWIVLQGALDKVCNSDEISDFVSRTSDAELVTLPAVGHGFSKWSDFMPQWKDAFNRLIAKYEKGQSLKGSSDRIKNLPLAITDAKSTIEGRPAALFISGDGGWYSFEISIADLLADLGIPTIGVDSRKYFWKRKTPEETASDIAAAMNYYAREWGIESYMLIGYSFGAEIIPFIVNRLSEEMKPKILSVVLLSPGVTTDFEIHISYMLGMGYRQNSYNVTDEIIRMLPVSTLIIFGSGERTQIPDILAGSGVTIRKIPGDHHYKSDIPLIVKTMKDNITF
jgi:type IV secretory pathway VirJ component